MKKTIKYGIGISIILFLLSNALFGWPIVKLYNDFLSARFLYSLENTNLPGKSRVINSFKRFGILHGNSNHCDCEIAILIETDMNIKKFEKYVQTSLLIDPPFSSLGKKYSELYNIKGRQLFRVYKSNTIELVQEKEYPYYSINNTYEFYLQAHGYQALITMIKKIKQKPGKNYFIITAFDQTYSGISMRDIRCH
ncbi:MAG: hypothetical protein GY754_27225 [bacterium]|nr:hypothetical protein [bacterium]